MPTTIKDVINNVKDIFMSDASLATVLNFERVISELDIYAFANWKQGELVDGPVNEKHFVTCTFMWPYKMMPDPRGGERLLGYDCEVTYKKSHVTYPVKITSQEDFKENTKIAKTAKATVWLVTIAMPRDLIEEIQQGSLELENESFDIEEIENAYQDGVDEEDLQSEQGAEQDNEQAADPEAEELSK